MDNIQELLFLSLKQYLQYSDSVEDEINELHFISKATMTRELRSPESRCVYYLRQMDINSKSINQKLLEIIQEVHNLNLQNLKFDEPCLLFQEILEFIYSCQHARNNFNLQEDKLNNLLTCSLYNGKIWSLIILLNTDKNMTVNILQLIRKIYYSNHPDLRLVLNSIILYISNQRENVEQLYLQILKYCKQFDYQNELIQLIKIILHDQNLLKNNEIKQIIIDYFIKYQDTSIQIWSLIGNIIYHCDDILKQLSTHIIDIIQVYKGQYFKIGCQLFVKVLEITSFKLPSDIFKQLYDQLLSKDIEAELMEKGLIINCLIAIILYTDYKLDIADINIQEMSFLFDIEDVDIQLSLLIFFIVIYQQEQVIIRKENYQFQRFINKMMVSDSDQCRDQAKYLYEELYDKQE